MQVGQRVGWTTGDEKVYRKQGVQALRDLGTAVKRSAADGATAHGDHNLGLGNRFVGLQQGGFHVF